MSQDYRVFAKFVRRVQRRLYQRRLLQGGVLTGTVALALLLLGVAVQPLIPRLPLTPVIYSAMGVLAMLALLVYVLRPAVRWVPQRQALARIEETYPGSHDDLRNALQLDAEALARANPHGVALDLVQALHRRVARQVGNFRARSVVRRRRLQGVAWCAMLVLAAVGVSHLQPGALEESWRMLTQPHAYLPDPAMHITIEPQQAVIARGSNPRRAGAGERSAAGQHADPLAARRRGGGNGMTWKPRNPASSATPSSNRRRRCASRRSAAATPPSPAR